MKRTLPIVVLLALTYRLCPGTIIDWLPAPQDSFYDELYRKEELKAITAELYDVVENRICPLKREGINRILGPKLSEPPNDMVLPIFAPHAVHLDETDHRPEFHAIGKLGYIQCYYRSHGDTNELVQWGWFHRAD